MAKYRTEYRINKKGCEVFRTEYREEAVKKLNELQAKRPGVYSMQSRLCQVDRHGVLHTDGTGRPSWGRWA